MKRLRLLAVADGAVLGEVTLDAQGGIAGIGLGAEVIAGHLADEEANRTPAEVFDYVAGWSNGYVVAEVVRS